MGRYETIDFTDYLEDHYTNQTVNDVKRIGMLCKCLNDFYFPVGADIAIRYSVIGIISSNIEGIKKLVNDYKNSVFTLYQFIDANELLDIYKNVRETFITSDNYDDDDFIPSDYDQDGNQVYRDPVFCTIPFFNFCKDNILLKEKISFIGTHLEEYVDFSSNDVLKNPEVLKNIEQKINDLGYLKATPYLYDLAIVAFLNVIKQLGQELRQNQNKEFYYKCEEEYKPFSYSFGQFKVDYEKADNYGEPREQVLEYMETLKWKELYASGVLQAGADHVRVHNPGLSEDELCKLTLGKLCKRNKLLDKEKVGKYFLSMGDTLSQTQRFALFNFGYFRYFAYHKDIEEKENKKTAIDNLKSVLKEIVGEHLKDKNIQFDNSSLSPSEFFSLCYVIAVYNSAYDSITESKNKWAEFVGGLEVDGAGKSMVNKKLVEMIDKSVSPETAKSFKESGKYKEEIETITRWLKEKQERD